MILRATKFSLSLTGLMNRVYEKTLRDSDFAVLVALDEISLLSNSISLNAKQIKTPYRKKIIFETNKTLSKKKFKELLLSYIISGMMRFNITENTKEPHFALLLNEDNFKKHRELFSNMQITLQEK